MADTLRILCCQCKASMVAILEPIAPPKPPPPPKPAAPPPPPPGPPVRATLSRLPTKPRVSPGPKPTAKMKGFFWDKIPDSRVDGTFWEDHKPSGWLDYDEVEKLFQVRPARRGASNVSESGVGVRADCGATLCRGRPRSAARRPR